MRLDANGDTELHPSAANGRLLAFSTGTPFTPWRRWTIPRPHSPSAILHSCSALIPTVHSPLRPGPRFYQPAGFSSRFFSPPSEQGDLGALAVLVTALLRAS